MNAREHALLLKYTQISEHYQKCARMILSPNDDEVLLSRTPLEDVVLSPHIEEDVKEGVIRITSKKAQGRILGYIRRLYHCSYFPYKPFAFFHGMKTEKPGELIDMVYDDFKEHLAIVGGENECKTNKNSQ